MALKPGRFDPTKPDIELFDFKSKKRFGLKLDGNGLQIGTISQDDSVLIRNAGKRVGDFDEQRSWKMGRGVETLSDNAAGYWDSANAWTLTDGHLHQTILWQFARGLRSADFFMPDKTHSVSWYSLLSTNLYLSVAFTSAGLTADYARMWIRRTGTPGTLTFRLHSNNSGSPGTVLQTVTKTTSDITDTVSVLQLFDWSGTQALTASTVYFISVAGAAGDTKANHWQVGGYVGGTNGKRSSDGTTWIGNDFDLFYYVADADISRTFYPFFIDGAMYVVDTKDDGTASQIWINGDRGKATAGTGTTLTDTAKAWTTNKWTGSNATVRIVRGTGVGQFRLIASNTATQLTVTTAWSINPDSTSEYIIYSTPYWTEITGSGLGQVVGKPAVVNQIAYFPQGSGTNIRRMIWNGTAVAHQFSDDGTNKANYLTSILSNGSTFVAAALKVASTVAFAPSQAYGTPPTALTFGTARLVGSTTHLINNIIAKDNLVFVFKESGVFNVDQNLNVLATQNGMENTPALVNGVSSIVHQQFMYYSWLHSLIRVYGQSHDDIGQGWSGKGLPNGREGYFSSMDTYTSLLICGVNAGIGTSSVLGFDGMAWHEMLRAYDSGKPIRMVKVQPNEGIRNFQWTEIGGDLVYQEMPLKKGSPRLDAGMCYQHEAVIESAAIDMGTASGLPKMVKELTIFSKNLGSGNEIAIDFQTDDNVGTTNWTEATRIYESPEAIAYLGLDNIRKFSYRLRIRSSNNTAPIDILGVTPNGYARAPYKMVWTLRCKADNITSRGRLVKPPELMRWLLDTAKYPGRVMMLSQYELAHRFFVIVHPPRMFPYKPAQAGQSEEDMFTIVLEES